MEQIKSLTYSLTKKDMIVLPFARERSISKLAHNNACKHASSIHRPPNSPMSELDETSQYARKKVLRHQNWSLVFIEGWFKRVLAMPLSEL